VSKERRAERSKPTRPSSEGVPPKKAALSVVVPAELVRRIQAEHARVLGLADGEALVCRKLDSPSRSLLELACLMASAHKQGFALVALDCALAPTTPAGEALVDVLCSFAPCERGLISKRTRQALALNAQGVRLGRPPTMSPYAIERIRRERAAGTSLAAIANGLNADRIPTAQGGRRWYPATVRYTLNRAQ
jgi:DNA invertase Pin-like site-specific DNA recombinase